LTLRPRLEPRDLASCRDDDGRFTHPWPVPGATARGPREIARWQVQRLRHGRAPNPDPAEIRTARPAIALPRGPAGELRITWVGHATFLLQLGTVNVLTDPVWSRRASPLQFLGPRRFIDPGVPFDALPPIDAVLLSHDHYDHLDDGTVRRLCRRFGAALQWVAPLGYTAWLRRRGAQRVVELDWWQQADLETPGGDLAITATPAQHWTRRTPFSERTRLWASFMMRTAGAEPVYCCGDSGYFPGFEVIGRACGPFGATLLPIGAYEPRWFMKPAHMNPEEAVRAYLDLGRSGLFAGMHWGTFRLTDEPPLEPPRRVRTAWAEAGLPAADLWLPRIGETRIVETGTGETGTGETGTGETGTGETGTGETGTGETRTDDAG
jgi:N-acyl-phosphatidylethanolamine-hydrolysing phospholipase D